MTTSQRRIASGKALRINWFGGATRESQVVDASWTDELRAGNLTVTAYQDVTSGAKLKVILNGKAVHEFEWHAFDTEPKTVSIDISSVLFKGRNTLLWEYSRSGFHMGPSEAIIQSALLTLEGEGSLNVDNISTIKGPDKTITQALDNLGMYGKLGIVLGVTVGIAILFTKRGRILGKISDKIKSD